MKTLNAFRYPKQNDGTIHTIVTHETFQLHYTSDVYDGYKCDTTVKIFPAFKRDCICVIAGVDIDNFTKDFAKLIEKYRI